MPGIAISWAVRTDAGLRRTSNEDSYSAYPEVGLFVVADGMGGHVAGEIASRVAVESISAFIKETAGEDRNRTWPFPFEPELSMDGNRLKAAFRLANRKIGSTIADSQDLRGMATTASAILVSDAQTCVAHIGDSRVYVQRADKLSQITDDHSWVEEQVRAGMLTPDAARAHPWRNVVTRALSGAEDPEIDVVEIKPAKGDRFLLCSDGLFGVLSDDQIGAILSDRRDSLSDLCGRLIEAANAGGGPDNITALIVQIDAA